VAGGGPRTAHSQPSSRLDPWGVGVPGLDRLQSEAAAGKFLQPDLALSTLLRLLRIELLGRQSPALSTGRFLTDAHFTFFFPNH
jgi:hypothetical protein